MQEAKTGDGESKRQRTDEGRKRRLQMTGSSEEFIRDRLLECHGADVPWAAIHKRGNGLPASLSFDRS
jgi:hypothetical protein